MPTRRLLPRVVAAIAASAVLAVPATAEAKRNPPPPPPAPEFDLQAHRGGLALRPENTLSSFGNAMQLGVSTLELDVQITEDGEAVVTHDRRVTGVKCQDTAPAVPDDPEFPYVGKYINTLTLAQVSTLDCGNRIPPDPATDPFLPTLEMVPGSKMPLLSEVFALVKRYGSPVQLNIETKVEIAAPHETAPREQFVQVTWAEIQAAGVADRVTIQSFDWGTLMRWKEVAPDLPIVALVVPNFLQIGQPGASVWLGGIDIDDWGGDWVAAAHSFGASAVSPLHGEPQNGKVTDPGYVPFTTAENVAHAHELGMKVVPWTVDDEPTMAKLMDDGVDGIITDFPDRLRDLMAERGYALPEPTASPFDVQAHRGGRAYRPENTLPAFEYALANPDVSTLELDVGVTRDYRLVVAHDRAVSARVCQDTAPARPGDPQFPYVGDLINDLTLRQIRTLDCGSLAQPDLPVQQLVPGAGIPTLDEVFALVKASGRTDIRLNIETKLSPLAPGDTVRPGTFALLLSLKVWLSGLADRVTIQSFDWRTIEFVRWFGIETVALVWQYGPAECQTLADGCSLRADYDDPSLKSPWTAGHDWWETQDLAAVVSATGASTVSSNWQVHDPNQGVVVSDDWYVKEDPAYFHGPDIAGLHAAGLKVVPYTINDEVLMDRVIALGVDGIISDDHEALIRAAKRAGLR